MPEPVRLCDKCGQPLSAEARRDPPLPPLAHPNVVTIHDLPADARGRAKVIPTKHDREGRAVGSARFEFVAQGESDGR